MALQSLRRPLCPATSTSGAILRSFSSTPAAAGKSSKLALRDMMRDCPAYPYPIKHTYKQSWFGLYDGKHIQFGNNIPDGEYSAKTKRTWKPNVKTKKLYSKAMGKFLQVPLTTSVLRTIDKVGGVDEYLLSIKPARLASLGPFGWKMRHELMQTPKIKERFREESAKLGIFTSRKQRKAAEAAERAALAEQGAVTEKKAEDMAEFLKRISI
ncbi:ribosomal L28 family-domain-containing protein [Peziza echinospora]|nr:ribosomal L28 family-domain-containing protein [Peziza echinospora]